MTHKPISGPTGLVNRPNTPKLWAIANEYGTKSENDKFSAMTLKPVSGPICLQNSPRSPKKSIAHEKGLKTRKRQIFSHDSQNIYRVK